MAFPSIPDHGTIIDRLKQVAKIQSDAGLSKWLGKPDSFIAVCRNREGINIDVIVPKLDDSDLLFVLRGQESRGMKIQDNPCLRRPERVWAALGNPSPDDLALRMGVSQKRARDLLSGREQPTGQELVDLLDDVASIAMAISDARPHSRSTPEAEKNRRRRDAA